MVTPLRRKLLRDLGRHRAQFVAICVTMLLGVAMFAASYDSFRNLQASYAATATEFRFANLTVAGGDVERFAATAASNQGVAAVERRTSADVPFRVGGVKLLGRVVTAPAGGQPAVNRVKVLDGEYPAAGVLVEQHMAEHFGLRPGASFDLLLEGSWEGVTVDGVAASPEYIWPARSRQELLTTPDNFGVVFVTGALAERIGSAPNEAVVYFDGGEPQADLEESLAAEARRLGATTVYTRAEQPSNAALEEDLRGFEEMAVFFPLLFLTAAGMAAYVMISRLVHTQRPHVGVMLANGFTRRQVLAHYLGYGIVPGLIGALPGALAGVLLARVITRLYTDLLAIPVTLVRFYPITLVGAVAFGLAASLLAALAPALVAARVQPATAMRGESPARRGRRSLVERVVPPLRRLPVTWRMTLRGVGRNPRRATYTIVGVVLSLVLVLVSWGMIDTIRFLLDRQFVEIQREDATVYFAGASDPTRVAALTQVDGVAVAEPTFTLPVALRAGGLTYDTSLVVLADDTQLHRFVTEREEWIALPKSGLVLGAAAADLLGLATGDPISLTGEGIGTLETTVAAFVDEPLGTMAYASRSHAETLSQVPLPATAALVAYEEGADPSAVRATLTDWTEIAAFEDAKALYGVIQDYMVLFYGFVGVMLVFGAAMAFALIFNSMSVNIGERTREVATLLAVGTDRRSISRSVAAENLLVAGIGIPLGLVAGHLTARAAMESFSSDLFTFDLHVEPTTYVWVALAILVVASISQWPGLRAIKRIDIPKIVKERSA